MKYIDENGLLYLVQKIQTWDNGKVDKVNGKGLSTYDFDATYKAALDNLATNYVAAVAGKGLSTNDYDNTEKQKNADNASAITTIKDGSTIDSFGDVETALSGKVDTVSGKGLSTNDYDNTEKAKVAAAQTASQVTSAIEGYGYQTSAQVASAIATALAGFTGIDFSIVSTLPASGTKGIIYLVSNSGSGNNSYDEYIWITIPGAQEGDPSTSRFEKIGTTDIDLSGYVQTSDLSAITNAEIDTIIAGGNS